MFSRSHHEDPRDFQDQHVRAYELLDLHKSQPPNRQVRAAKCLGGIREAQTIMHKIRAHKKQCIPKMKTCWGTYPRGTLGVP